MPVSENIELLQFNIHHVEPVRALSDIIQDAAEGLLVKPRSMPPKYFYDERGSNLFDEICNTSEYYPTRTEDALLRDHARRIIQQVRPEHIIEFGSGTSRKTRRLLDVCDQEDTKYWPFDVCQEMLEQAGQHLVREYDWLEVNVLVGDYHGGLQGLPDHEGICLFLFLGGTIGNFDEQESAEFMAELFSIMKPGDCLLLGADRIKDEAILNAAYNDAQGYTAEFNLNLLNVLNRELDAGFQQDKFMHLAEFNEDARQIEMYLESVERQTVHIGALDTTLELEQGERIRTEISRKFSHDGLESIIYNAGLRVVEHYEPANGYFSLVLATKQ